MTRTTAILVFAASARKESLNKKLAKAASESAGKAGAEVTLVDEKQQASLDRMARKLVQTLQHLNA